MRFFDTGDQGRVDEDGNLHILGRRGLIASVGGVRVDVLEVEAVLSQHGGVEGAIVVQVADNGAYVLVDGVHACFQCSIHTSQTCFMRSSCQLSKHTPLKRVPLV